MRNNFLESVTGISKCDKRLLLRDPCIAKCDNHAKMKRNNLNLELLSHLG